MLKKLIIVGISSLSLTTFAKAPSTYSQVRTELQKVSQKELIFFVNSIVTNSLPSRMVGKPGHDKTRAYLLETIQKLDIKNSGKTATVSFAPDMNEVQSFYQKDFDTKVEGKIPKSNPEYEKWKKFTRYMQFLGEELKSHQGQNIIWEKAGLDSSKVLVITAHYDTISFDLNTLLVKDKEAMPGANYNASGMAVALGLIKTLASADLNYSVQVAFLDWQGIGYLGSRQYATDLKSSGKKILGVMNLEMLGQDTSFFDKTKKTGNMSVYSRDITSEVKWVTKLTEMGKKITEGVNFEIKPNNFDQSDTFRFWEKDIQAVTFSQNWEDDFNPKFYQSSLDTPETLNHETLYKSYQYIGGAALGTLLDITK